jgi:hypothetical protein
MPKLRRSPYDRLKDGLIFSLRALAVAEKAKDVLAPADRALLDFTK